MLGKLKGLLREQACAGENPYQTPNSWVSLSLSTLWVLFGWGVCMCIFSNVCIVPSLLPSCDAVLLYGKISQGTPPIFPSSSGTIPVLCPRVGQGTKAGSRAGDPAAPLLWTGSPCKSSLVTGAGDRCHLAKPLPRNLHGPTLVELSQQCGPLAENLPSRCH